MDIVESHHEAKIDAPSGFALALAGSLAQQKQFTRNQTEKEKPAQHQGWRAGRGSTVHSIRMPGRSAHHEVIFGAAGQTVTLRHDTLNRECLHARGGALHPRGRENAPDSWSGWKIFWGFRLVT